MKTLRWSGLTFAIAVLGFSTWSDAAIGKGWNETVGRANVRATCTIRGTSGNNKLRGTSGADVICGLGGKDHLFGRGGADLLLGGNGNDWLYGEDGNDISKGGAGRDKMFDHSGLDRLLGGDGSDICMDTKDGKSGDAVDGGRGTDHYLANSGDTVRNVEGEGVCPPDI
jgi:Ca2+-binding RTX toxin-like protein